MADKTTVEETTFFVLEGQDPDVCINEKPMGLFGGSIFVFGSMIGTGIFISVKDSFSVFTTNNILGVLLLWIFGALVSLVGSLCYAELGITFPKTGGESVYYKETIGKKFSVTFVVTYVFVVKTISLAAVSITASKYLVNTLEITDIQKANQLVTISTVIFLLVTLFLNFFNRNFITKFLYIFSLLKVFAMGSIIIFGFYYIANGYQDDWKGPYEFKGFNYVRLSFAFMGICWSYEGWNSLGLKAGDIRNPSTNLLLSSIIGVFLVSISYVATVISYSAVLGFQNVRNAETVALDFSKKAMKSFYYILPALVSLSALGSMVGNLFTLGGVATYAGLEGMLPGVFCLVHKKTRIAHISIVFITMVSSMFIFLDLDTLIQYCAFITWFFYFLSFTSLWIIKLRNRREKTTIKSFTVNYFFILFVQFVCIYIISMCFFNKFYGCLGFAIFMLTLYLVQYIPLNYFYGEYHDKQTGITLFSQAKFYTFLNTWFNLERANQNDIQ